MPDKEPGPFDRQPYDWGPTPGEKQNFFTGMLIGLSIGLAVGGVLSAMFFYGC